LTASIAHEINQPLAAVVNSASACARWLGTHKLEEARQCALRVVAEGHRAGEMLNRIRALARKAPPQPGWLELNQTLGEVLAMLRAELHRHRVALKTQLTPDLPALWADRVLVQQVLLNLLLNAIEALSGVGEGPRELSVSSQHVLALPAEAGPGTPEAAGPYASVAVRDTGSGLDPQGLERLFEAFYTTKPQGLGMGLAISRSIIEAHGGRLWAWTNVPRGAVFEFALPIRAGGSS
jgi:C4-dicarboxylate-specific signal transduction histidine kinase